MPAEAVSDSGIPIIINNRAVCIPEGDEPASVINQRVYVPIRVVSEGLGAHVAWLPQTRQVVITTAGTEDGATSDETRDRNSDLQIVVDGRVLELPPSYGEVRIVKSTSRVIVPLRAVAEALGCSVNWSSKEHRVEILSGTAYPNPSRGEQTTAPSSLFQELASYRTNLRLLDGTVINSADLLDREESSFSEQQLEQFAAYRSQLAKYDRVVKLPDGSELTTADLTIRGQARADADQLRRWLAAEEPRLRVKMAQQYGRDFIPIPDELADLYLRIGEEYGIRGDLAFCQAAKETCYWQFVGSVQPFQNNYCGLWATGSPCTGNESLNGADPDAVHFEPGVHGAVFASPEVGVEAHIQHLYAYACRNPLPEGKVLYDPRFNLVARGCAPTWQGLNARWAVPGTTYGQSIIQDWWIPVLES